MQHTPAQQRAIFEHDRNLIVVAGAGSGKTRVLVERYLALLDANPDWPLNALVAITFTRKAAGEMRDRVRAALEARRRTAANDDQRRLWAMRLAAMDSARIDTIHGLCAAILRANAAEAQLDPDFVVLEEADAQALLDEAIDTALQELIDADSPVLALFAAYDANALRSTVAAHIAAPLPVIEEDLLARWAADWTTMTLARVTAAEPLLGEYRQWVPATGWPAHRDDKLVTVYEAVHDVLDRVLDPTESLEARCAALVDIKVAINLRGGAAKAWGSKAMLDEAKNRLRGLRALVEDLQEQIGQPPGPLDAEAARLLPLWADLINAAQTAYADAKKAASALDFDDLERRTRDLLDRHEAVRARYCAGEFRHLLVDEFQDTNATQWDIVRYLAPPDESGRLFVVGDPKQSIYAFRGADVSVFDAVRRTLTADESGMVALARSFRAHSALIDCFNALFAQIFARDPSSPTAAYEVDLGEPMAAQRTAAPGGDRPALAMRLVDRDATDRWSREDMRRWEALAIADYLQACIAEALPIYDRDADCLRPIGYGDIALLFQSTTSLPLYEEVFKAVGLPFVTVAGRGYYSRTEVWDLLTLLRALHNPADDLSLAGALRSPLFGLSDDALLALRLRCDEAGDRLPLWAALNHADVVPEDERDRAIFAARCLDELRAMAGRVTISELLRSALARTGYLATLTGLPDGDRRRGNVEKLLQLAAASNKVTLSAFTQHLGDLSAREVREGEADLEVENAVTLMTVHASKGLEFPLVVLVDTSWSARGGRGGRPLVNDPQYGPACKVYVTETDSHEEPFAYRMASMLAAGRDEAERRRLLYVAATRAADYLVISGQISRKKSGEVESGLWLGWLIEALDVGTAVENGESGRIRRNWGALDLWIGQQPPDPAALLGGERRPATAWTALPDRPRTSNPADPPLLAPLRADRAAVTRHLSVTQLDGLGTDVFYAQRFRRQVLHDAPAALGPALRDRRIGRLIGEMVHEVLRWCDPADVGDAERLLRAYAWENGITDAAEIEAAVGQAAQLLRDFATSDIARRLAGARHSYRELPFVLRTGQRILHGVLDLLIEEPDGIWTVIDYKTGYVADHQKGRAVFEAHARRYALQVGTYAEAVARRLGDDGSLDAFPVTVYIHYIRYGVTIALPRDAWRDELRKLEHIVGQLIE